MKKMCVILSAVMLFGSFTGCASIVSKSTWPVTVQSNPTGAKCEIIKENGVKLHTGETPMTLSLEASAGFFSSAKYIINCTKDGKQATSELSADLNGWYLGNILFGGVIGLLIIDPATGAMWKLEETRVVNIVTEPISVSTVKEDVQKTKGNVNQETGAIIQPDITL